MEFSKFLIFKTFTSLNSFYLNCNCYFYRPRFGLFSNPVSTAVGDNGAYRPVPKKVDADGQVKTEPRNFYTTKMKKGHTDQ
jgi:hypothetical protein